MVQPVMNINNIGAGLRKTIGITEEIENTKLRSKKLSKLFLMSVAVVVLLINRTPRLNHFRRVASFPDGRLSPSAPAVLFDFFFVASVFTCPCSPITVASGTSFGRVPAVLLLLLLNERAPRLEMIVACREPNNAPREFNDATVTDRSFDKPFVDWCVINSLLN
jgi:hypothetical protein